MFVFSALSKRPQCANQMINTILPSAVGVMTISRGFARPGGGGVKQVKKGKHGDEPMEDKASKKETENLHRLYQILEESKK